MLLSRYSKIRVAVIGFALAIAQAKAAITITFSFDGTNTTGVVSGSIILPPIASASDLANSGATFIDGGYRILYVHVTGSPSYDFYNGGSSPTLINLSAPSQWSGPASFGFLYDTLYTPANATPGGTFAPTGTFTWNNQTPAQVGVAAFTTPAVVYAASNGEQIRFVTTIPEPTFPSLAVGSAALAALAIRRRSR